MIANNSPKRWLPSAFLLTGLGTGLAALATGFVADVAEAQEPATSTSQRLSAADDLSLEQSKLADKYNRLEELLFKLAALEERENPRRAALLRRAFEQSKERLTKGTFEKVVKLLSQKQLKLAVDTQGGVKTDLESLLQLLQSEDRTERLKNEQARIKEYIKEVERLLRLQKSLSGQTEAGAEAKRLAKEQAELAQRAQKLGQQIEENEEGKIPPEGSDKPSEENPNAETPKPNEGNPKEGKPGDPAKPADKPKETPSGEAKPEEVKPTEGKPGESKPSEGQPNEGKPSESKPGEESKPAAGPPPEGQPSDDQPAGDEKSKPPAAPGNPPNPARLRINQAEQKMKDAQQKLEQAKRKESQDDQREAREELEKAKAELEQILRQMREEEVERTLAQLEARFRKMLEMELRVYESTKRLDQLTDDHRGAEFQEQAAKLGVAQGKVGVEAQKALTLMLEEGSSVAFPATVQQMHEDMLQTAGRLADAKIDEVVLGLEEDIIASLEEMIEAIQKAQQDLEQKKNEGPPPPAQAGQEPPPQPLVNKIAELKMIKSLQERVNKRTSRFARLLTDEQDRIGQAETAELQDSLRQLAEKQQEIFRITKDVVLEKNK